MSRHNGANGFGGCGQGITAMAKRLSKDRIYGPYKRKRKKKPYFITQQVSGITTTESFATESEAEDYIRDFWRDIAEEVTTVRWALDKYEVWMRDIGHKGTGNDPDSVLTTRRRLDAFLPLDEPIDQIDAKRAAALYKAYRDAPTRTGRPPTAATHQAVLRQCRSFFKYVCKEGWMDANPFADVESVGKANTGKDQLRVDELRRLLALCLKERSLEALACLFAALFGLRASEILRIEARDIDDRGRVLWVRGKKTKASTGKLRIPEVAQPWLRQVAKRPGKLFPKKKRHWVSYHVERLAKAAGVPRITAHGARGSYATAGTEAGALPEMVAQGLRQERNAKVAKRHYIRPESLVAADHDRVMQSLVDNDSQDSVYPLSTREPDGARSAENEWCEGRDSNPHEPVH